uniref:Sof1-like protein domain-containing protein n=1 Tax=Panagrolaimus davidi TaxID=227884 RepID=A0A914QMQ7_9BILA
MLLQLQPRENASHEYNERLKKQYQNHLQTGTIIKHRQVPKIIFHTAKECKIIVDKKKRKEGNLRRYAKPGTLWILFYRWLHILFVVEFNKVNVKVYFC